MWDRVLRLWQMAIVRFLVVGGLSTLVQFVFLIVLIETQMLSEVAASAVGYFAGALVNYLLNYYFTFNSEQNHSQTLPKFILVVGVGACVNTGVFAMVHSVLPWYWLSQCFATGASLCANFVLHRFWIYRLPKEY